MTLLCLQRKAYIHIERINPFDPTFWRELVAKLEDFYDSCLAPEIGSPVHVLGLKVRIKNFTILKRTLPLTLARLANQMVCVCAWLTSFQPALVPLPLMTRLTTVMLKHILVQCTNQTMMQMKVITKMINL